MYLRIWGLEWLLVGDVREEGDWADGWLDPDARTIHIYKTERMVDVACTILRLFGTITRMGIKAPSWKHVSDRLAIKSVIRQIDEMQTDIADEMGVIKYGYDAEELYADDEYADDEMGVVE